MNEANEPGLPRQVEETALLLGQVAKGLDGSVTRGADLAARERFLVALGSKRPARAARWLAAAAVVTAAALVVFVLRPRSASVEYSVVGPASAHGEWLAVPPDRGAVALRFTEGTEIELGPGSQGRVAEATPNGARVVLGNGELHARVVHRPHAKWAVAAGPYDIEVTGTAFDVGWSAAGERLELSLHDGSVVVRGPSLKDGIRVAAGQRLIANARSGGAELSSLFREAEVETTPGAGAPPAPAPSSEPPAKEPSASPTGAAASWAELVSVGNFRAVLDAAAARGFDQVLDHGSLRDLVALSDAARYGGDRALARRGLLAQRTRFASSAESHAAAFVLGRMADDGGSPSEALKWYDGYLREAPKGAFAAEALGRRLVVLVRLGNKEAAREAADGYTKRFPRGAHAAYAREVLEGR